MPCASTAHMCPWRARALILCLWWARLLPRTHPCLLLWLCPCVPLRTCGWVAARLLGPLPPRGPAGVRRPEPCPCPSAPAVTLEHHSPAAVRRGRGCVPQGARRVLAGIAVLSRSAVSACCPLPLRPRCGEAAFFPPEGRLTEWSEGVCVCGGGTDAAAHRGWGGFSPHLACHRCRNGMGWGRGGGPWGHGGSRVQAAARGGAREQSVQQGMCNKGMPWGRCSRSPKPPGTCPA